MAVMRQATLWLARHAPVLAEGGLCYGATDLRADDIETRAAAEALAARLPRGLNVLTSPLQRCERLALALQGLRPDLVLQTDARLREMDFGSWEGRRWADIPRADFDRWLAGFADTPPAAGAETVRALMERVGAAWDDWRASGADALWVTHAGVMRAALLLSRGVRVPGSAAGWPADALPFGGRIGIEAKAGVPQLLAAGRRAGFTEAAQAAFEGRLADAHVVAGAMLAKRAEKIGLAVRWWNAAESCGIGISPF